jgi:unsaturated rhamnogalacturonyl hydrolase
MYTYTIAKAVERGYDKGKFRVVACKGYHGVLSQVSRGENGDIHIANICVGTNVGELSYYLNRSHPIRRPAWSGRVPDHERRDA